MIVPLKAIIMVRGNWRKREGARAEDGKDRDGKRGKERDRERGKKKEGLRGRGREREGGEER